MSQFFKELRRRNVFRVAVAYAVVAWLLIEIAATTLPILKFPDWSVTLVTAFVLLGFPLALIFAWAFEITPEGVKREKHVDQTKSITQQTGRKLDFGIIGFLAIALVYFIFTHDWSGDDAGDTRSIAVLPFVNMSDDPNNEFFSDGISETLLNMLAKVPDFHVVGRTSSFSFKGKDQDLREIAQKLGVVHVLEGSVRKAGNQVRITAQLVQAEDGFHLWSETYDRTLDDIFAIQDEIAAAVVAQLKITLLGAVPTVEETDPEAYALFLQARHLGRQSTTEGWEQSNVLYQRALVMAPDYAAAWAGLADNYVGQAGLGLRPFDEGYTLAREAANKALAINPDHAPAHATLGWIAMVYDNDLAAAARHFERALALEPANLDILGDAAVLARTLGRRDEAIALREYLTAHDPVNPRGHFGLGSSYYRAGQLDEAIASLRTALTLSPGYIAAQYRIGEALVLKGEPEAALAAMQQESFEVYRLIGLPMAYHALGQAAESDAALTELIEKYERDAAYNIAYVLAFRGEADRAFAWLDRAVQYNDPGLSEIPFERLFTNIHDDPRWLPFLESIGKSPEQMEQLDAIELKLTLPK